MKTILRIFAFSFWVALARLLARRRHGANRRAWAVRACVARRHSWSFAGRRGGPRRDDKADHQMPAGDWTGAGYGGTRHRRALRHVRPARLHRHDAIRDHRRRNDHRILHRRQRRAARLSADPDWALYDLRPAGVHIHHSQPLFPRPGKSRGHIATRPHVMALCGRPMGPSPRSIRPVLCPFQYIFRAVRLRASTQPGRSRGPTLTQAVSTASCAPATAL